MIDIWEIKAEKTVLLMIDMQNDFVLEGYPMAVPMARERLLKMRSLLEACRQVSIPVVYTKHILFDGFNVSPLETSYNPLLLEKGMRKGSYGAEIVEHLEPQEKDVVVEKHRYDAFHNTQLQTILSSIRGMNAVDTLIIAGTLTEVCCESTARSAYMRDYKVAFASDATGALSDDSQTATMNNINNFFGRVMTVDEIKNEIS